MVSKELTLLTRLLKSLMMPVTLDIGIRRAGVSVPGTKIYIYILFQYR